MRKYRCSARGCPTRLEFSSIIPGSAEPTVEVYGTFGSPTCVHFVGDVYGQLRGSARAEWKDKNLQPHAMQLKALASAPAHRVLAGNMKDLPRQSSAQRLSSDQRTGLRKDKDVLKSLELLLDSPATQNWLHVSMKPASAVIVSERMFLLFLTLMLRVQSQCVFGGSFARKSLAFLLMGRAAWSTASNLRFGKAATRRSQFFIFCFGFRFLAVVRLSLRWSK